MYFWLRLYTFINNHMAKEKKKYPMFPVVFTQKNEDVLEWVRSQAQNENRSVSNFIITKLREIKNNAPTT